MRLRLHGVPAGVLSTTSRWCRSSSLSGGGLRCRNASFPTCEVRLVRSITRDRRNARSKQDAPFPKLEYRARRWLVGWRTRPPSTFTPSSSAATPSTVGKESGHERKCVCTCAPSMRRHRRDGLRDFSRMYPTPHAVARIGHYHSARGNTTRKATTSSRVSIYRNEPLILTWI